VAKIKGFTVMNTIAATAVPLIAHPSPIDVATDEISGGHIGQTAS